ncbi:methyl-accepting chemotaxis protein [Paenibacillus sp. NPDC058071]|uniref:methyl-accepting chemotaxis protein n=1 Tax=Paenibacillus sp. NPDC058071 TaxID=3346326 RepID=UPI0036DE9DB7
MTVSVLENREAVRAENEGHHNSTSTTMKKDGGGNGGLEIKQSKVQLSNFLRTVTSITVEHTCKDVISMFKQRTENECMVVEDAAGAPIGLVMRNHFFMKLSHRFGADLYYDKSISELMDHEPLLADIGLKPQLLMDEALNREENRLYDCVIVTKHNKLAGILTMSDLLRMSRLLQQEAVDGQLTIIRNVSDSMKEIDRAVVLVQEASKQGEASTMEMVDLTLSGKNEVDKVSVAFSKIAASSEQQVQKMNELQAETGLITRVSKLIRELAEQSNLLAINASIEAARAGEHGRGFAVVASEVMKLAGETKRSADEITTVTRSIVEVIEETAAMVRSGSAAAAESETASKEAEDVFSRIFHAAAGSKKSTEQVGRQSAQAVQQIGQVGAEIDKLLDSYFFTRS